MGRSDDHKDGPNLRWAFYIVAYAFFMMRDYILFSDFRKTLPLSVDTLLFISPALAVLVFVIRDFTGTGSNDGNGK